MQLKWNFDPNVGDFSSMTPVAAAIERKRTDVLKILLEQDELMVGEEKLKAAKKATMEIHQMLLDDAPFVTLIFVIPIYVLMKIRDFNN